MHANPEDNATAPASLDLTAASEQSVLYRTLLALFTTADLTVVRRYIVQYGRAAGHADAAVVLLITDDGQGFDAATVCGEQHQGLRNMRARAEEAGGTFSLQSGSGTRIHVAFPRPREVQAR